MGERRPQHGPDLAGEADRSWLRQWATQCVAALLLLPALLLAKDALTGGAWSGWALAWPLLAVWTVLGGMTSWRLRAESARTRAGWAGVVACIAHPLVAVCLALVAGGDGATVVLSLMMTPLMGLQFAPLLAAALVGLAAVHIHSSPRRRLAAGLGGPLCAFGGGIAAAASMDRMLMSETLAMAPDRFLAAALLAITALALGVACLAVARLGGWAGLGAGGLVISLLVLAMPSV